MGKQLISWTSKTNQANVTRGLQLLNGDGSLMAFVCNAMPQDLRSLLFPSLIACFDGPGFFKAVSDEDAMPFDWLHFSWYNRYATKVISMQHDLCLIGHLIDFLG